MKISDIDDLKADICAIKIWMGTITKLLSNQIGADIKEIIKETVDEKFKDFHTADPEALELIKNKINDI